MANTLVLGVPEQGKTSLCIALASEMKRRGLPIMVCDPLLNQDWTRKAGADYVTRDFREFAHVLQKSRGCRVFIDECYLISQDNENDKTLTNIAAVGRHYGHQVFYIGQRATAVSKTVRMLSTSVYSFAQGMDDAIELRKQFRHKQILEVAELQPGEYLAFNSRTCQKLKLF